MVINQIKIKKKVPVKKIQTKTVLTKKSTVKSVKKPKPKKALSSVKINKKISVNNFVISKKPIQKTTTPVITNTAVSLDAKELKKAVLNELNKTAKLLPSKKVSQKSTNKPALSQNKSKTSNKKITAPIIEELPIENDTPDTMVLAVHRPFKNKIGRIVKWTIGAIAFLFLLITVNLYYGDIKSVFNRTITEIIPYPGAIINSKVILLKDFQNDLLAVEKNLKRQDIPYTITEIKNNAFKTLVQREIISSLAKEQNLNVTNEEINEQLDPFIEAQGGVSKAESLINDLYGWNIETLKKKVIKVLLLHQKLSDNFKTLSGDTQKAEQLKQVKENLNTDPEKFNDLAKQNEDNSKFTNGDLGWFKLGETLPAFEAVILNLKPGEISDILETAYGYHLIKLEEKKIDENQEMTFHASQIFLQKNSFADYLNQEISKAKVIKLIK